MSIFVKIKNLYRREDKTHPAYILCKELMFSENDEELLLKFIAFRRETYSNTDDYVLREGTGASKTLIEYLPVSMPGKVDYLYHKMELMDEDEFGISPIVIKGSQEFKIPMIDFIGSEIRNAKFILLAEDLGKKFPNLKGCKLMIFSSGRSYHGYLNKLVTDEEFYLFEQFLTKKQYIVDQNWVKNNVKILRWSTSPRFHDRWQPKFLSSFDI